MTNYNVNLVFAVFCTGILFIAGCFPENSLEWSADGSVGLLQQDKTLYLVDSQSGKLTEVAKGNVMPWPDISDDGKLIAYSEKLQCDDLTDGLKLLPENLARKIKAHAEWMKNKIIANGLHNGEFPRLPETRISGGMLSGDQLTEKTSEYTEGYRDWVIRCLCETADDNLIKKLTSEVVSREKNKKLIYYRLIVVPRERLSDKKIVATSISTIFKTMFSPDCSNIAYLMINPEGSEGNDVLDNMNYQLNIASPKQNIEAMLVAYDVAFGYDWRQDGQALAYMRGAMDDDMSFGALSEVKVADSNGILLAKKPDLTAGAFVTHTCRGHTASRVGIVIYPWMKLQYGPGGRIFFTSLALSIPMINNNEPRLSLFCYDTVTQTVNDVLPSELSSYIDGAMSASQFSLSRDGKSVLLPIRDNRFMIYELGSRSPELPIEENEGFGEENVLEFAPAWKGNNEISCLVSEKSHFLIKEGQEKYHRKEIVILGADGKFLRVLSENWPGI